MLAHIIATTEIDNISFADLQKSRTIRQYFHKYAAMHKSYTNSAEWGTEAQITNQIVNDHGYNKMVVIDIIGILSRVQLIHYWNSIPQKALPIN